MNRSIQKTPPPEYLQAIGLVASEWARLEFYVQTVIARVGDIHPMKCLAITKSSGIDSWLDALEHMLMLRKEPDTSLTQYRKLRRRIKTLQGIRNDIVHGVWCQPPNPSDPWLSLGMPKRGVKLGSGKDIPLDYINKSARHIAEAAQSIWLIGWPPKHA